jgi:para-nitrobenzyl esterase
VLDVVHVDERESLLAARRSLTTASRNEQLKRAAEDAEMSLYKFQTGAAVLWIALSASVGAAIHQAQVSGGTVVGAVNNGVASFKGIPFAAAPMGHLRWKPPQPVIAWDGIRRADSFGLPCAQTPGSENQSSEDCLFLNVWTAAANPAERRPVMVWIHGGGFNWGATWSPTFDGARFAEQGVVLVSVAYRLGVFGFLAHPQLSRESGKGSGAYALQDQIAALKWVQQNISQFGGDPTRVTIFGGSAGGGSVSLLAAAPAARGLFHRAISQSGGAFNPGQLSSLAVAEATGQRLLQGLGTADIAAARSVSADQVLEAASRLGPTIFAPLIDGDVVRGSNAELYRAGRFNDTPILIGFNSDDRDGDIPAPATTAAFAEQYRSLPPECGSLAKAVVAGYQHSTDAAAAKAFKALKRDAGYGWQSWTWAHLHVPKGKAPVYLYYFDLPNSKWPDGAPHGAEVLYVFANLDAQALPEDSKVSALMQRYWINFASKGDPNGPGLPHWPAFDKGPETAMVFDLAPSARPLPHADRIETFDRYLACVISRPSR